MNKNIIFLGPPGSGKGTQAQKLVDEFGLIHLSTGNIIRNAIKNKTETGLKAQKYIDNGLLLPDAIMIDIVNEVISKIDKNFILDGFPRTIVQAEALEKISKKIDVVLYLEIDFSKLFERLTKRLICPQCSKSYHEVSMRPKVDNLCDNDKTPLIKRVDDEPDKIKIRTNTYLKETLPLIDFYKKKKMLQVINANQESENVFNDIKKVLV